jgi:hypothetical protein
LCQVDAELNIGRRRRFQLQRVVNVMQQFLMIPKFNIDSMLLNG